MDEFIKALQLLESIKIPQDKSQGKGVRPIYDDAELKQFIDHVKGTFEPLLRSYTEKCDFAYSIKTGEANKQLQGDETFEVMNYLFPKIKETKRLEKIKEILQNLNTNFFSKREWQNYYDLTKDDKLISIINNISMWLQNIENIVTSELVKVEKKVEEPLKEEELAAIRFWMDKKEDFSKRKEKYASLQKDKSESRRALYATEIRKIEKEKLTPEEQAQITQFISGKRTINEEKEFIGGFSSKDRQDIISDEIRKQRKEQELLEPNIEQEAIDECLRGDFRKLDKLKEQLSESEKNKLDKEVNKRKFLKDTADLAMTIDEYKKTRDIDLSTEGSIKAFLQELKEPTDKNYQFLGRLVNYIKQHEDNLNERIDKIKKGRNDDALSDLDKRNIKDMRSEFILYQISEANKIEAFIKNVIKNIELVSNDGLKKQLVPVLFNQLDYLKVNYLEKYQSAARRQYVSKLAQSMKYSTDFDFLKAFDSKEYESKGFDPDHRFGEAVKKMNGFTEISLAGKVDMTFLNNVIDKIKQMDGEITHILNENKETVESVKNNIRKGYVYHATGYLFSKAHEKSKEMQEKMKLVRDVSNLYYEIPELKGDQLLKRYQREMLSRLFMKNPEDLKIEMNDTVITLSDKNRVIYSGSMSSEILSKINTRMDDKDKKPAEPINYDKDKQLIEEMLDQIIKKPSVVKSEDKKSESTISVRGVKTSSIMTDDFNQIVRDLHRKIQTTESQHFDYKMQKKYGITKFTLKDLNGENVEAWVFDEKSKPHPIVEDQVTKVFESLMKVMEKKFARFDSSELQKKFQSAIDVMYDSPLNSTIDMGKELIKAIVQECLTIYNEKETQNGRKPTPDEIKSFNASLWHQIDFSEHKPDSMPAFRNSHILVINQDPKVESVQYYQRKTKKPDLSGLPYRSAHARDEAGIPNFIAYGAGHISQHDGSLVLTDTGFRHASLPPIGLYKREDKTENDCVRVTAQNMEALMVEMGLCTYKQEYSPESMPLNWINVSLLTATQEGIIDDKFDNQGRQYRETILAVEVMRAKYPTFKPITFDFGVNDAAMYASSLSLIVTPLQEFENRRAFLNLHELFFTTMISYLNDLGTTKNESDTLSNIYGKFVKIVEEFRDIEAEINQLAKKYVSALDKKDDAAAFVVRNQLNQLKEDKYEQLKIQLEEYQKIFNEQKGAFKEVMLSVGGDARNALEDFMLIDRSFVTGEWKERDHNFELQARIIDLGACLGKLKSATVTSFNCKSGNDRSGNAAARVDEIRLKRQVKEPDYASHYRGSASVQSAVYDTAGGGPKFKGAGVPDDEFAKLQERTSKWAAHKQYEKVKKARDPATIAQNSQLEHFVASYQAKVSTADAIAIELSLSASTSSRTPSPLATPTASSTATIHQQTASTKEKKKTLYEEATGEFERLFNEFKGQYEAKKKDKLNPLKKALFTDIQAKMSKNDFINAFSLLSESTMIERKIDDKNADSDFRKGLRTIRMALFAEFPEVFLLGYTSVLTQLASTGGKAGALPEMMDLHGYCVSLPSDRLTHEPYNTIIKSIENAVNQFGTKEQSSVIHSASKFVSLFKDISSPSEAAKMEENIKTLFDQYRTYCKSAEKSPSGDPVREMMRVQLSSLLENGNEKIKTVAQKNQTTSERLTREFTGFSTSRLFGKPAASAASHHDAKAKETPKAKSPGGASS